MNTNSIKRITPSPSQGEDRGEGETRLPSCGTAPHPSLLPSGEKEIVLQTIDR